MSPRCPYCRGGLKRTLEPQDTGAEPAGLADDLRGTLAYPLRVGDRFPVVVGREFVLRVLGISLRTLRRRMGSPRFPQPIPGEGLTFRGADLEDYIHGRYVAPADRLRSFGSVRRSGR